MLLVDLGIRAADLGVMYTDDGMFSRTIICRHYSIWNWSFHFGSGSWSYQAVLFGCAAVFAFALLVGYETRLATMASWLMLVSMMRIRFIPFPRHVGWSRGSLIRPGASFFG